MGAGGCLVGCFCRWVVGGGEGREGKGCCGEGGEGMERERKWVVRG